MSSKTQPSSGIAEVHSLDIVDIQIEVKELAVRLAAVPLARKIIWCTCRIFPKLREISFIAPARSDFDNFRAKLDALAAKAYSIADRSWGADADHVEILKRYIAALSTQLSSLERINALRYSPSVQWFPFRDQGPCSLVTALQRELDEHWISYMPVMFDELLHGNEDPLLKRAEALGTSAIVNSVAIYPELVEKFPALREEGNQNWDFVLSVAGIFMAATELNELQLGDQRKSKVLGAVGRSLSQLRNGDGDEAFRNCEIFVQRYSKVAQQRYPHQASKNHAIGLWAIWNILDRGPANPEEFRLIRATGALIHEQYSKWWQNPSDSIYGPSNLPANS